MLKGVFFSPKLPIQPDKRTEIITTRKRSLEQGNVFTPVYLSGGRRGAWGVLGGSACKGGLPPGGSASGRSLHPVGSASGGGLPTPPRGRGVCNLPRTRKSGGTHPTGMLSCLIYNFGPNFGLNNSVTCEHSLKNNVDVTSHAGV